MLRKCHEHEYARGWSCFIVVLPVFLSMLLALLALFTPSRCMHQKMPSLDHGNRSKHTQRCAHTQNSIACPTHVYPRAFQHKIYNNNHSGSEHSIMTCDGSI
jgi:hypothetical protein